MAVFTCKMCGGTLETTDVTVAVCAYCGTKQTLPRLGDERIANLYERANHFRRNNDFDKAMGIYEQILNEDPSDAEAYWSLVLCRYGIEYIEDPASRKRIPTVNRAQFTSIYEDEDYRCALRYADSSQKEVYEQEAHTINEIQKGILTISSQEEPFDVFICYKETDSNGRRTRDSVLATELYHELTREGYKVFFSRITLEDKLGTAYEPYIFAALNSAKVMVVLGTKPEHFNAVWVKNEWSRFFALIKNGARKTLIPAYRDMDPYDLPEEFSHLQAQDMSKLGFMQDLIRGIQKIAERNAAPAAAPVFPPPPAPSAPTPPANPTVGNITALLKRGFMALEDGDFPRADGFFEEALNHDAENADAYLGKLLAQYQLQQMADLAKSNIRFDSSPNYQRAYQFGDEARRQQLAQLLEEQKSSQVYEPVYLSAIKTGERFKDDFFEINYRIRSIRESVEKLETISFYKDSQAKIVEYKQLLAQLEKQQQSSGCYIATAVYGSYDCPQVWTLRRFRDNTLGKTWYGRAFIRIYYAISPTLVKWFGRTNWFKKLWQSPLDRMVADLNAGGVANTPYRDKDWR